MGEMADYFLDQIMDIDEIQQNYQHSDRSEIPEGILEHLYDYDGTEFPKVFSRLPSTKPSGPGSCPKCGGDTVERTNKKTGAKFWGCSNFPDCKGNRDY